MNALILLCLLAADPPAPPCPQPTPREAAWTKLADANKEWFRLQAIADAKAHDVAVKRQALADKTKELQGDIDAALAVSGTAASAADTARHAVETAGNDYAEIVDPGGAEKKPTPAKVELPKPVIEKPKVKVDVAPTIERPKIIVYYGADCVPCHNLMTAINNASAANQLGDYDITYQLSGGQVPLTDLRYRGKQFQYQGYATYELWLKWVKDQIASVPK